MTQANMQHIAFIIDISVSLVLTLFIIVLAQE